MSAKKTDPVTQRLDAVLLKLLDVIEKQAEGYQDPIAVYEMLCRAEGARRGQ